jgi:hypothetical protein
MSTSLCQAVPRLSVSERLGCVRERGGSIWMAPLDAANYSGGGGPCLRSRGLGESTARSRVPGVRADRRGFALGWSLGMRNKALRVAVATTPTPFVSETKHWGFTTPHVDHASTGRVGPFLATKYDIGRGGYIVLRLQSRKPPQGKHLHPRPGGVIVPV